MYLFLFVLMILFISLAFSLLFDEKLIVTLPFSILFLIVILYLMGLLGFLSFSFEMFLAAVLLSSLYVGLKLTKNKEKLLDRILSPGIVVFIIFICVNYIFNYNRLFAHWDEFSHWGLVVKNMFIFEDFGISEAATTVMNNYPPGSSLFLYLFASFAKSFKEDYLYMVFGVLQVSLLLPVLKEFKPSDWKKMIIPALVLIALPLSLYYNTFYSLYVDCLLGLLLAYILYAYYSSDKVNVFLITNISLALIMLTLTKPIGLVFALIGMMIILGDILFTKNLKVNINYYFYLIPLALIFIIYISWEAYLLVNVREGTLTTYKLDVPSTLSSVIAGELPGYWYVTILEFAKQIIEYLYLIIYFVVLSFIVNFYYLNEIRLQSKNIFIFVSSSILGFVLYSMVILSLYLTVFTENEAEKLASFSRYMNSYVLGIALVAVYFLILIYKAKISSAFYRNIINIIAVILVMLTIIPAFGKSYIDYKHSIRMRSEFEHAYSYPEFMSEDDNIFFISQGNSGLHHWIFRYTVTPVKTTGGGSLGSIKYFDKDIYTWDISVDDLTELLINEYTYLYLFHVDEIFTKQYGSLFDSISDLQNDRLFKIHKEHNRLRLNAVSLE